MGKIEVNDSCVGCSACEQACPTHSISMKVDREGFIYPVITEQTCVECSVCQRVCPLNKEFDTNVPIRAFYGWHKDESIRFNSSSGGLFSALAEEILEEDGIVFGAAFDGKQFVYQNTDDADIALLRKSKYTEILPVQSFRSVKEELKKGRKVLFCGTPCRCAGLKSYLGKDYDNLYILDFICGGVASPKFLNENMKAIELRRSDSIRSIDFRSKKYGWGGQHAMNVVFSSGKIKNMLAVEDPYFALFLQKIINRKSCYQCKFASKHVSDITMGDFWEFRKIEGLKNDKKGISLGVVHTIKGETMASQLENFDARELDYSLVQGNFREHKRNETKLKLRREFFESVEEDGFIRSSKRYVKLTKVLPYKVKNLIKRIAQI